MNQNNFINVTKRSLVDVILAQESDDAFNFVMRRLKQAQIFIEF